MSLTKKQWTPLLAAGLSIAVLGLSACSDDDGPADTGTTNPDASTGTDAGTNPDAATNPDASTGGFEQPANTVAINFTIDDSANKTYGEADLLRWKGSFTYDATTRILTHDPSWAGGDSTKYPLVYDDGPWNAGGHEPAGATAGDNVWGITVFFPIPAADTAFEYGAEYNNGSWIWSGPNGTFTVPANASAPIDVTGLVIPAFGTVDLQLKIDTSALAEGFTFTPGTTTLTVKGSSWSWQEVELTREGETSIYVFTLGDNVGPGTTRPHAGLLRSGDQPEFVFVIGGVEYKAGGEAAAEGVTAYLKFPGETSFSAAPIERNAQNGNTYVDVPAPPFVQPAGTVAINFTIDDSANATYTTADLLRWKGSFTYDAATRILTHDPSWAGGDSSKYPLVYDDGPWNRGGHEPAGAVAGDNIWGVTVFFPSPAADTMFEYGAEYANGSWIWRGSNGTFTVPAGATQPIDATGLVIPAFGQIDLMLELDTTLLAAGFGPITPGVTTLTVKGSAWGWQEVDLVQDTTTASLFRFVLDDVVGPGTALPHAGLLSSGDRPEFVFVIGGVEYKEAGIASASGVAAYLKVPPSSSFSMTVIDTNAQNGNTYVAVP
ncbi:hypothetical protein L6R52_14735 [Myxococcota bacterium]|nr:hypothetical protein [Myxococcota bacterium]